MASVILRQGIKITPRMASLRAAALHVSDNGRSFIKLSALGMTNCQSVRHKSNKKRKGTSQRSEEKLDVSYLVQPVAVTPHTDPDGVNVGEELAGILQKGKQKWAWKINDSLINVSFTKQWLAMKLSSS